MTNKQVVVTKISTHSTTTSWAAEITKATKTVWTQLSSWFYWEQQLKWEKILMSSVRLGGGPHLRNRGPEVVEWIAARYFSKPIKWYNNEERCWYGNGLYYSVHLQHQPQARLGNDHREIPQHLMVVWRHKWQHWKPYWRRWWYVYNH